MGGVNPKAGDIPIGDSDISPIGDGTLTGAIESLNTDKLNKTGDTKDNTTTFTSSDVADGSSTAWTSVPALTSGEKHTSIFSKMSQMFKNIRYLYKMLGTTDISAIGDGTVTGVIKSMNDVKLDSNKWINKSFTFTTPYAFVKLYKVSAFYKRSGIFYGNINLNGFVNCRRRDDYGNAHTSHMAMFEVSIGGKSSQISSSLRNIRPVVIKETTTIDGVDTIEYYVSIIGSMDSGGVIDLLMNVASNSSFGKFIGVVVEYSSSTLPDEYEIVTDINMKNYFMCSDIGNSDGTKTFSYENIKGMSDSISDTWSSSVTYGVNAYCIYNNSMWKCLVQHSNQTPTEGTYWTKVSIGSELKNINDTLIPLTPITQTNLIPRLSTATISDAYYSRFGNLVCVTFTLVIPSEQTNEGNVYIDITKLPGFSTNTIAMKLAGYGWYTSSKGMIPISIQVGATNANLWFRSIDNGNSALMNGSQLQGACGRVQLMYCV